MGGRFPRKGRNSENGERCMPLRGKEWRYGLETLIDAVDYGPLEFRDFSLTPFCQQMPEIWGEVSPPQSKMAKSGEWGMKQRM